MPHTNPVIDALENPWELNASQPRELDVGDGHVLWWAQGGVADPAAPTVLVIHGGPGGRSRDEPLGWLAGAPVRWLCWDQRGCGRSRPAGYRVRNDLDALLSDIDALLAAAGVARVAILAGSWGAVPALEYARTRGTRVAGVLLRSAFTGTAAEVESFFAPWDDWLGDSGREWLGPATVSRSGALAWVAGDGSVPRRLAWAWSAFEAGQARPGGLAHSGAHLVVPDGDPAAPPDASPFEIQAHFLVHGCFLPGDPVGRWIHAMPEGPPGPLALVHGADDAVCPVATSQALARQWPRARLEIVEAAGHRMSDERLGPRLRAAVQDWCRSLVDAAA